jgi:uncharacterized coiled-coil DUF342 family protein
MTNDELLTKNMELAGVIRSLRANAREDAERIERLKRERDEAREQNVKLRDIAERAIDDLRWFYEGKSDSLVNELDQIKEGAK